MRHGKKIMEKTSICLFFLPFLGRHNYHICINTGKTGDIITLQLLHLP